jgi:biotin synthase
MHATLKQINADTVAQIYQTPLTDLIFKAQQVHREHHNPNEIQLCTLSSIKTGACPEDCSYCSQSARYKTGLKAHALLDSQTVLEQARAAKANGSTRFCMGAAWREVPDDEQFEKVLDIVSAVKAMDLEPCVTLGMLSSEQAGRLKAAGLHSYNHNIDSSEDFYPQIISTRTFQDRLDTIAKVQEAGINLCCGGILGLGESREDRWNFLNTLANFDPQPQSVPVNVLIPIAGTPVYEQALENSLDNFELVRTVATARILMPRSQIRLSAGRLNMSEELQALCFIAGANSIHTGTRLLTTDNPGDDKDHQLINKLGLLIKNG